MKFTAVPILTALLTAECVSAAALSRRNVLHERSINPPESKWRRGNKVARDAIIPLRIGLVQNNLELGDEHLMAVSDPLSDLYGKHWTAKEVHDFFAPAETAALEVKQWLAEHGFKDEDVKHYENKAWLALDVPVHKAEEMFKMSLYEHEHQSSGSLRIGCSEYHVPEHIQHHIDYITPGVKLSPRLKKRSTEMSTKRDSGNGWPRPPHWGPPNWGPPGHHGHHGESPDLSRCDHNITPPCIRALYHIPIATRSDDVNAMGIYEDGDYWDRQDLKLYFEHIATNVPSDTVPEVESIDGGTKSHETCPEAGCIESDLDIDMAYSLIYPQKVIVYQVDDPHIAHLEGEGKIEGYLNNFLDALDGSYCNYTAYGITGNSPGIDAKYPDSHKGGYKGQNMCGTYKPTRVISISYGEAEVDLPINYQKRQCNEFMKLGLQGHTFLVATGDYGVATAPGDNNTAPNGCLSRNGQNGTIFTVQNPVNCPYITAVGGTQLIDETVDGPESAMSLYLPPPVNIYTSSSGGFSNIFPIPSWQQSAVSEYLTNHNPGYPSYVANGDDTNIGANGGRYNRAGRGYPDVSANGANFAIYTNGSDKFPNSPVYGTSCAAPLWGSVITLINEERTAAGKGPVGFINNVLYSNPHVLNDITNGTNPGCHSNGFSAVAGWDPVTGLGTPNYPKMLELFMSLP